MTVMPDHPVFQSNRTFVRFGSIGYQAKAGNLAYLFHLRLFINVFVLFILFIFIDPTGITLLVLEVFQLLAGVLDVEELNSITMEGHLLILVYFSEKQIYIYNNQINDHIKIQSTHQQYNKPTNTQASETTSKQTNKAISAMKVCTKAIKHICNLLLKIRLIPYFGLRSLFVFFCVCLVLFYPFWVNDVHRAKRKIMEDR